MISKPCLVVSIQNQLTLCIGTVIVRQIPVARKLKLLFGDCADARNKIAESFWKQNYADAVHVLWISSSINKKIRKLQIARRTSSCIFLTRPSEFLLAFGERANTFCTAVVYKVVRYLLNDSLIFLMEIYA